MNYATGLQGFIGNHLSKKLDIAAIPHEQIGKTPLEPFEKFFFLSSYGNLITQTDEYLTFKANVEDLIAVLRQTKGMRYKSFIYCSSSSVMLKKQTTYSRCKRAAEEILFAHMERNNLPVCIVRPFSVTGVGEQKEHLIPTLIDSAFTGKTVNFDPTPTHDFIDVEDVVEGLLSLAENGVRGVYQLGTGKLTTNQEVLETVEKVTGKKIKVNITRNMRPYDNDKWVSNNFKARGYGWLPQKSLEQSITEMVGVYESK